MEGRSPGDDPNSLTVGPLQTNLIVPKDTGSLHSFLFE